MLDISIRLRRLDLDTAGQRRVVHLRQLWSSPPRDARSASSDPSLAYLYSFGIVGSGFSREALSPSERTSQDVAPDLLSRSLFTNLDSTPDPAISIPVGAPFRPITLRRRSWRGQYSTQYTAYDVGRAVVIEMVVVVVVVMMMMVVMLVELRRN